MTDILLLLLLLLLVGFAGVVLGVHLQAAKSKTDCGCGKARDDKFISARLSRLETKLGLPFLQAAHDRKAASNDHAATTLTNFPRS